MLPLRLKPQIPTSIIETLDMLENDLMLHQQLRFLIQTLVLDLRK